MTLAWVARLFIFLHVGIPVLILCSLFMLFEDASYYDWCELLEWVWTVEYARD